MARHLVADVVYCAVIITKNLNTGSEHTNKMGPYATMGAASSQLSRAKNDHVKYPSNHELIVAEIRRGDTTWTTIDPVKEKKRLKAEAAELKNKQEEDRLKNAQDDFYKEMWS